MILSKINYYRNSLTHTLGSILFPLLKKPSESNSIKGYNAANGSLKVLQLGKFYPLHGGVEKVMYNLLEGLSAKGIRCDMLCAAESGFTTTNVLNDNSSLICTKSWCKSFGTMISPEMIIKLKQICAKYDIIHVHHPDPMACLALWCSGYKGRLILHWHSDIIKQHKLLKLYIPLQQWLLHRSDQIICTSESYMTGSEHLQPWLCKCKILPIGIKPLKAKETIVSDIKEKFSNYKMIFSLGRLVPYKGFEYLIDAANLLPNEYRVIIGGAGPLQKSLSQRIEKKGLQEKVQILGYLSDEEAASYFASCDLFCLPSVCKTEAFGIVQLEAMSFGKPIVATFIPGSGVSWVNAHGVSGINVPLANPSAIADAILHIFRHPNMYTQFSNGAKNRYNSIFTLDKMIDNTLKIYRDVMNRH